MMPIMPIRQLSQPETGPDVTIIMGGQFGSEGKGELTAWYASAYNPSAVVRVGGPNAGHTMTINNGMAERTAFKMRHIPCAWHTPAELFLGPGALVNISVLNSEMGNIIRSGHRKIVPANNGPILHIDLSAVIITEEHAMVEASADMWTKIGSTLEGVGAARAARIMRSATLWGNRTQYSLHTDGVIVSDRLVGMQSIVVESTQGFGLSLTYSNNYPQVTSADITPAQALNDAGLGGQRNYHVIGVMRTYPIRVAGNSGGMYKEITWAELAARTNGLVQPERTTVTNRIRRVGEWDPVLARKFRDVCKPDAICLTMVDYKVPELAGVAPEMFTPNMRRKIATLLDKVEQDVGAPVRWVGVGPGVIVPVAELLLDELH